MALKKVVLIFLLSILFIQVNADRQNQELTDQEKVWLEQVEKADSYAIKSKYDSALFLAQEIALASERENNYEFMTRSYLTMAGVYFRIRKLGLAIDEYHKAMSTAKLWGNEAFVVRSSLGLGVVYNQFGANAMDITHPTYDTIKGLAFLDSAFRAFELSDKYYRSDTTNDSNLVMLAYTSTNLASNYFVREDYLRSSVYRKEAINRYMLLEDSSSAIRHIHYLGSTFLQHYKLNPKQNTSYLDSAKQYLQTSYKLGLANSLNELARSSSKDLAFVNQTLNRTDSALYYWNMSDSLLIEVYSNNYEDRVLQLRAEYQTAAAELEAEKAMSRSLRLERNRNITLMVAASILVIFSIWLYVLDQRRKSIKAIAAKNEELNKQRIDELLQQQEIASLQGVLEGQEQERKRVAIDLHDRLGGILSMVKLHFSAVEEKLPDDNPEKKKFLTASELLDLAAGEVRNISHNLLSGVLAKFGLLPALKDLTDRINESGEISLNLIYHNVEGALNGEQELQIYRIVQELISNILKHSDASEATIQLIRNADEKVVNLIVEDDGKGFNPSVPSSSGGIGLANLKARVSKLNGHFHIDSGKGAGTSVSIDIPIEDD